MKSIKLFVAQALFAVVAGIAGLGAACAKHDATSPVLDVLLTVSAGAESVVEVHQSVQLTATVRDSSGAPLPSQSVAWSSSDTTIATVSKSGVVGGRRPGAVTITATCDAAQATIALTVVPPVANVAVHFPSSASLAVGGSAQMDVGVTDASGNAIVGLPVSWSSSNASLATVVATSSNGLVAAVSAGTSSGTVAISATVGGVMDSTLVTIVPLSAVASITASTKAVTYVASSVGFAAATQLSIHANDTNGNPVLGVAANWSISNSAAATISSTGLLTPNVSVLEGSMATATVTGTVGSLSDSVSVVVCPQVHSIAVSTTSISLQVGQSVTIVATALDAHGDPDRVPLDREFVNPNGMVVSPQSVGFDSLLVTGVAGGTSSLDFIDPVSGTKSQTIAISVAASEPSVESDAALHMYKAVPRPARLTSEHSWAGRVDRAKRQDSP